MPRTRRLASLIGLLILATGSLAVHARTRDVKIHGCVTRVDSPTQFEIEDYRITRDRSFSLDIENGSPDLRSTSTTSASASKSRFEDSSTRTPAS